MPLEASTGEEECQKPLSCAMLSSISIVSLSDFSISSIVIFWDSASPSQHSALSLQKRRLPYISSRSAMLSLVSQISG